MGVKEARATPGNRGVLVMRRVEDGRAEFFFASFWESMDAIRGFAGEDVERAVYCPEGGDTCWISIRTSATTRSSAGGLNC